MGQEVRNRTRVGGNGRERCGGRKEGGEREEREVREADREREGVYQKMTD